MSQITITKGKILKGDKVEIDYIKQESSESKPAKCSEEHTDTPHKDLRDAFHSLAIHAALIGEFVPVTAVNNIKKPDPEITRNYNVSGFSITNPDDDDETVIITAQKTLKTGKAMGFNTPMVWLNDTSDNAYPHLKLLSDTIDRCKDELTLYLNGKYADKEPDNQTKMDLKS